MGDAVSKLQMFVWILTMFQGLQLGLCLSLKHQTWSNDNSESDLSCGGVNLSIG